MALVTVAILLGVELLESIFMRLKRGATERELENMDLEE
jgi:hypothetical protein